MAEAIFQNQVQKMGLTDFWEVESAGILRYHIGNVPEPRAMSTLQKFEIQNYSHIARQITTDDFYNFNWIFGMDEYNIHDLYAMQPEGSQAKIELLGKYDPAGLVVIKDPIFDTGIDGFEEAFQQAYRSICAFLEIHNKYSVREPTHTHLFWICSCSEIWNVTFQMSYSSQASGKSHLHFSHVIIKSPFFLVQEILQKPQKELIIHAFIILSSSNVEFYILALLISASKMECRWSYREHDFFHKFTILSYAIMNV
ncbi:low molecular weight phosphotyrosine protein phosphatase 1-like isoform X2 [Cardiocondyla obscurior]